MSAAIDDAHAIVFEVLRQSREFGLPQVIRLMLRKPWAMLPKPMILPVFGSAAIKTEQDDGLCPPKIGKVDGLIATVAALVDDPISAKSWVVL